MNMAFIVIKNMFIAKNSFHLFRILFFIPKQ